jgi:carbonic anhydrase
MSCPNSTSPIDISLSNITGNCDYKCAYNFNYNNSSCVATNRGDYISLAYDNSSTPSVIYNSSNYNVSEIRLYIPSLHSYSGSKSDGELIIIHNALTGSKPLLVCIPIKGNNTNSVSGLLFKAIVDTVSDSAPDDGESTTVPLGNQQFNLKDFVPMKPFFSYSATEPFQPCSSNVDLIVYDPLNAYLDMMPDTLKKLQTIIQNNLYDIKTGPNLFYNEKGPNLSSGGGEIYIDCQPVGQSEETKEVVLQTNNNESFNNIFNSQWLKFILFTLLIILILYGLKLLLNMFNVKKGGAVETVSNIVGGGTLWKK